MKKTVFTMVVVLATTIASAQNIQITTAEELAVINIAEGHYILMNDLVLDNWKPLGNIKNEFNGQFNGNGHIIIVNSFDTSLPNEDVGLFGTIGKHGTVKNLKVAGNISYASGDKSLYIGGVAGFNYGTITDCVSEMNITANGGKKNVILKILAPIGGVFAGGIAGINLGYLKNCYSTGNISVSGNADKCAGGIIGTNGMFLFGNEYYYTGYVVNCYATGSISAKGDGGNIYAGGVIGQNYYKINNCIAINSKIEKIGKSAIINFGGTNSTNYIAVGANVWTSGVNRQGQSYQYQASLENIFVFDNINIIEAKDEAGIVKAKQNEEKKKKRLDKMLKDIGRIVDISTLQTQSWWEGENQEKFAFPFGNNETAPWSWDEVNKRPVLYWENGYPVEDTTEKESRKFSDNIEWRIENDTLFVNGTGVMPNMPLGKFPIWYDYRNSFNSVVVGEGITKIGRGTFSGHNNIHSIIIAESVTDIAEFFNQCKNLSVVEVKRDVPPKIAGGFVFTPVSKAKLIVPVGTKSAYETNKVWSKFGIIEEKYMTTAVAFAQSNYHDVVYLKNGSIIRGVIIEQIPNESLKIETADGNLFVFKIDEVEKMTKEQSKAKY